VAGAGVSLKDSSADALFQQAITTLDMENVATVRSIAVRDVASNAATSAASRLSISTTFTANCSSFLLWLVISSSSKIAF
jgi:hypothetical protein